jgi:cation transport ATPase
MVPGPFPAEKPLCRQSRVGRAGSASARGRLGPGHDITKEASDLVIPSAKPLAIMDAFELSRLSIRTVHQNPCFAFLYNATAVSVAAAGLLNPLIAVLAMCMSSLTVIGNALRIAGK